MLSEAEMVKVRAQRHKMAEIMQREGISLYGPPPPPELQEFIERIGNGGAFTAEELAHIKEVGKLTVEEPHKTEKAA
jgi:hypothetical protein